MDWDSVSGVVSALQVPFAWRTSTTDDGAALESSPPAAMQEPDVVHATFASGTSMLDDGVPMTWGVATRAVPQLAKTTAHVPATIRVRHPLVTLAAARLMTFPVPFRHVPRR